MLCRIALGRTRDWGRGGGEEEDWGRGGGEEEVKQQMLIAKRLKRC